MESDRGKSKRLAGPKRRFGLPRYPFWKYLVAHKGAYGRGCAALVLTDAINVVLPLVVKVAIDSMESGKGNGVLIAACAYAGLMGVQAWGRYLWRIYLIGTSFRVATEVRARVFARLQRTSLLALQKQGTGDLLTRATQDVESVRMAVGPGILVAFDATLMLLFLLPPMFWLSWKMALLAIAFLPLVPLLTAFIGTRIERQFERLQTRFSAMATLSQESFAAIRFVKGWFLENSAVRRFVIESQGYEREGVQLAKYEAPFSPLLGLFVNLGTLLLLFYGGREVLVGAISLGTFVAFQRFAVQLSWPMEALGWMVTMHREAGAAHRRLEALEALEPAPGVDLVHSIPVVRSGERLLAVDRLRFAFPDGGARIECDDLVVAPGQRIAIAGPVGAGKTTFFRLLLRLYEPSEARMELLGTPWEKWPLGELRRQLALVEQNPILFGENLPTNASLGLATPLTAEKFQSLAHVAALESGLLERGEESLAERAGDFSGGQRQRVALLRALARDPAILLLDDALSAVDEVIERRIVRELEARGNAIVFATHRLAATTTFDEIWLFNEGRVVARDTHRNLLRGNALYRTLWDEALRTEEHLRVVPEKSEASV